MNRHLFLLHLRRGLQPGLGIALLLLALLVGLGADVPDSVGLGARAPESIVRGIRRTDLALALLALLVPVSILQAARIWRSWEGRERAWLLASPSSKFGLACSAWGGAWAASLIWLLVIAGLCEWSGAQAGAGGDWRRAGTLEMQAIERRGEQGRLRWICELPTHAVDGRVRLSVGLYGLDNQAQEFLMSSFAREGEAAFDTDSTSPQRLSVLEVAVPALGGPVCFEFHARGAAQSMMLHHAQLDHFVPASASLPTLLLLLRVALLLAVAQALVLGLGPWLSPPTCLLVLLSTYGLVWLEADRLAETAVKRWLPGFDLPEALHWVAVGRGPAWIPLQSWLGACALVFIGLLLLRIGLGRWRPGR